MTRGTCTICGIWSTHLYKGECAQCRLSIRRYKNDTKPYTDSKIHTNRADTNTTETYMESEQRRWADK